MLAQKLRCGSEIRTAPNRRRLYWNAQKTLLSSATAQKSQGNLPAAYGLLAEASALLSDVQQTKRQAMASTDTQVPTVLIMGLIIGMSASFLILQQAETYWWLRILMVDDRFASLYGVPLLFVASGAFNLVHTNGIQLSPVAGVACDLLRKPASRDWNRLASADHGEQIERFYGGNYTALAPNEELWRSSDIHEIPPV